MARLLPLVTLVFLAITARATDVDAAVSVEAEIEVAGGPKGPKPGPPRGLTYTISEEYAGKNFLDGFNFEAIDDPTHGRVHYVNSTVAIQEKLVESRRDSFILRSDAKTVLDPEGPGRKSVRLITKNQYETAVMVFDVRHMPEGCGTWPAVWTVGLPWPHLGEIDIIEGVNNDSPNNVVLHTNDGCTMPPGRPQTGNVVKDSCGITPNNEGCNTRVNDVKSFGPAFNANGGGWYVMERNDEHIKVWFWPRDSKKVPLEVRLGSKKIDPSKWGLPAAYFPSTETCDFKEFFGPNYLVINLTFCGDWAGNEWVYANSGCPGSCVDHVNNNPEAFKDAFFDFKSIRIYKASRFHSRSDARMH